MNNNQRKMGVILSYISQFIYIISGVLYTPIMLRLLGQSEYGLYQLVYSVVSYMSLFSLGFANSYMRFYSRMKVKNDDSGIAKLNGMFMTIFICISCICLICGIVMTLNLSVIFGSGLTNEEYSTAKILMALMVMNLALSFPGSVFDAITSAKEMFVFQKILVVLQNLLNPFITLPLLLLGYGSVAMVVVTTILTLTKLVVNSLYCIKRLHVRFNFKGFDFSLLKEMWVFTFFIFLNMIVDQVNWSVGKFLLGRILGTVAVAVYGIGAHLNNLYLQLSSSVSSVFIPKVNEIVADTNDNNILTLLFAKVGRIQFIILTLILSGFVLFGQQFIALWAGEGYECSYRVALLLMIPVTIPLIQNLGIEIQRAKNMHKARSYVYFVIAITNIFVSVPCIFQWGIEGAAIGTAASLFLGNGLFMNWYYHKKIGINIFYFWKQIVCLCKPLVVPAFIGIVIKYFVRINGWFSLGVCIIIYTIIYCSAMYYIGMNKEEKHIVNQICGKIFKKDVAI